LVVRERRAVGFVNRAAKEELRGLPDTVRKHIGFQLHQVQEGLMPDDFKPMPTVGAGVIEIRVRDENNDNIGRCFYTLKVKNTVYILHSFIKKTEKTSEKNLKTGKRRLKELRDLCKDEGIII